MRVAPRRLRSPRRPGDGVTPHPVTRLERIVSGGQTGADRAALDVARELGIATGGWLRAGRLAEAGVRPAHHTGLC